MRKKPKPTKVPNVIELDPGLLCDSELKRYIDIQSGLTAKVTKGDFALITVFYQEAEQSPTGVAVVSIDDLIMAFEAVHPPKNETVRSPKKTRKKKEVDEDENKKRERRVKFMWELNRKLAKIHGTDEIFKLNNVRGEYKWVSMRARRLNEQKKVPSTKRDHRSPTTPPSL